jgi:hypothetical protein
MARKCLLLVALLVCSFASHAGKHPGKGPGAIRKQVESNMLVTGTIDITLGGDVAGYTLDQSDTLPKGIVDLTARAVSQWKFEPVKVEGQALSRSKMTLQYVARKDEDGSYTVELRNARFDAISEKPRTTIDETTFRPPLYPHRALEGAMVAGTVYLIVRYDQDGNLLDIDAEQINLRVIGSEQQMALWRKALLQATLGAAREWKLVVPPGAIPEGAHFGVGRIPVDYAIEDMKPALYGQWKTYVPGPRKIIPWLDNTSMAASAPDTLAPGAFHGADEGPRLLTPLSDS